MEEIIKKIKNQRLYKVFIAVLGSLAMVLTLIAFLTSRNWLYLILFVIVTVITFNCFYHGIMDRGISCIYSVHQALGFKEVMKLLEKEQFRMLSFRNDKIITKNPMYLSSHWLYAKGNFIPVNFIDGYFTSPSAGNHVELYLTLKNNNDLRIATLGTDQEAKIFVESLAKKLHKSTLPFTKLKSKEFREKAKAFNELVKNKQDYIDLINKHE